MITLEELIARQRFMLNRSTQASKTVNDARRPDAATANQWAEFEKTTAEATQELAEGLEKITGESFPMLFDAQKAMLAAAGDLAVRKFEPCAGHDREALANLVKARNTVRMVLAKPSKSGSPQEMRNFDRTQAQKLRRPKEKDEKQEAEQLPERLRQLAKQEEFFYATAAKPPEQSDQPPDSKAKSSKGSASGSSPGKPGEKKEPSADQPRDKQDRPEKPSGEPAKSPAPDRQKSGQEPSESPGSGGGSGDSKKDLQKLQSEIVEEARAVEQTMSRLAGQKDGRVVSELARSRMSTAVKKAEEAAGSIDRGNRGEAAKTAKEAAGMFSELAVHVEGLLGREAAQRLAAARDLADNLAQRERDLADRLDLEKAVRLAESGRTLEDLLRALAPGEEAKNIRPETVDRIEKLLREADAATLIRRMREVEGMLRAGRVAGSLTEARELAERLEVLSQRLDALHREVVAPRLAALIALEKRAAALAERLKKLESQTAIAQWHREMGALLQELSKQLPQTAAAQRLIEAMTAEGWGTDYAVWGWRWHEGHFLAPYAYLGGVNLVVEELQQQAGELLLRELVAAQDEATPPQYKELVERYFQVLSHRGSQSQRRPATE